MHDTIEGEAVETTAIALRQPEQASPALFGTSDPVEVVQRAVRVADALKAVVVQKNLIANISGKQYPQVEAWLTLAAMLRLTTICEWSRRVENGWEARVYVRDANGNTVGAAEAQCLNTERSKRSWEDYALRSMAQTRATSKSLRSVLGFIMVLAGYEATPVEEMPGDTTPPPGDAVTSAPRTVKPGEKSKARLAYEAWLAHEKRPDSPDSEVAFRMWAKGMKPSEVHERIAVERAASEVVEGAIGPLTAAALSEQPTLPVQPAADAHLPMTSAQKGKLMALHRQMLHTDEDRHTFYHDLGLPPTSGKFSRGDASRAIDALEAEIAVLRGAQKA